MKFKNIDVYFGKKLPVTNKTDIELYCRKRYRGDEGNVFSFELVKEITRSVFNEWDVLSSDKPLTFSAINTIKTFLDTPSEEITEAVLNLFVTALRMEGFYFIIVGRTDINASPVDMEDIRPVTAFNLDNFNTGFAFVFNGVALSYDNPYTQPRCMDFISSFNIEDKLAEFGLATSKKTYAMLKEAHNLAAFDDTEARKFFDATGHFLYVFRK